MAHRRGASPHTGGCYGHEDARQGRLDVQGRPPIATHVRVGSVAGTRKGDGHGGSDGILCVGVAPCEELMHRQLRGCRLWRRADTGEDTAAAVAVTVAAAAVAVAAIAVAAADAPTAANTNTTNATAAPVARYTARRARRQ